MKEDGIIESRFVFVCARKSVDNKKYTTTVTTAMSVKQHVGIRGANNNTKQTRSISQRYKLRTDKCVYMCTYPFLLLFCHQAIEPSIPAAERQLRLYNFNRIYFSIVIVVVVVFRTRVHTYANTCQSATLDCHPFAFSVHYSCLLPQSSQRVSSCTCFMVSY